MEEHEGGEGYLVVCSVGVGGDRRGVDGGSSERRHSAWCAAVLWRGRAAVGRPVSISKSRATHSEGRFGRRRTGEGSSTCGWSGRRRRVLFR